MFRLTAARCWRTLLVSAGRDLQLQYQIESATDDTVIVNWIARYTYSGTGYKVENHVRSILTVRDGLIINQVDHFDLCAWTTQALGMAKGYLACHFPSTLRNQARSSLDQYMAANNL